MATETPHELEVLRARAQALAVPQVGVLEDERDPLLVFAVGDARVGIARARVREVLPPGPVAGLPAEAGAVIGLRATRRDLLPVIEATAVVGAGTLPPPHRCHVVALDGAEPLGVLVEAVLGLVPAPATLLTATTSNGFTLGVTTDHLVVLDADGVLDAHRFAVRRTAGRPDQPSHT